MLRLTEANVYTKCHLCCGRIGRGHVDTRSDACRGDSRGIGAGIAGDCKEILGSDVEAEGVEQTAVLEGNGVTESDVFKLEIITVLMEL